MVPIPDFHCIDGMEMAAPCRPVKDLVTAGQSIVTTEASSRP